MPKTQIRRSIFETNSSSSHVLTLGEGKYLDTLYPSDATTDTLFVSVGDFGWSWETFNDPHTKLSYCAIYVRDWVGGERQKRYFNILTKVIQEQTGITNIVYPFEKDKYGDYKGYIDHQSGERGNLDYLFETPKLLRQFIFNPESTLRTGNDNSSDPLGDYE